jgi:hypothetical protein
MSRLNREPTWSGEARPVVSQMAISTSGAAAIVR